MGIWGSGELGKAARCSAFPFSLRPKAMDREDGEWASAQTGPEGLNLPFQGPGSRELCPYPYS